MEMSKGTVSDMAMSAMTAAAAMDMDMEPGILDDRVLIGPEFVPRRLDLPTIKVVMMGETWTPPATGPAYDYIEVRRGGILMVARDRDTTLRFTTMVILPGGLLDIGTEMDRIVHRVRFIVRDVAIDFTHDPYQWGNGLLNFGRQVRAGIEKTQCADLDHGLLMGQRTIMLPEAPIGWAAGDELVIPDTRFPTRQAPSRRESTITVESIVGATLTLSHGLDFDHDPINLPELEIVGIATGPAAVVTTRGEANWLSWYANRSGSPEQATITITGSTCTPSIDGTRTVTILGPNKFSVPVNITGPGNSGSVRGPNVVYACVCNIIRNISVESENPNGTPGHAVNVGASATWEMRDYMHQFLGRTRAAVLDSTIKLADGTFQIGNNQIARYGCHNHHTGIGGSVSYRDGAVIIGQPPFKWGIVEHGTHYAEDRNCTVVGYAGAGFVTEDGYERGNRFQRCIGLYISGELEQDNADANVTNNAPGIEGSAGWFRGVQDLVLDEFEGWCCRGAVLIFNQKQKPGMYPAAKGEVPSIPFTEATARTAVPAVVRDTLAVANYSIGFEQWTADDFLNVNLVSVRNRDMQYQHAASAANRPHLVNPLLLGDQGRSVGIKAGMAYIERLIVEGGYVGDCEIGLADGGGFNRTTLANIVFQCVQNIDYKDTDGTHTHTNVLHVPLKGHEPWYIQLGSGLVWDGVGDLLFDPSEHAPPCRGSQYTLFNHQGSGRNYQLFHNQSLGSLPAPYSTPYGFFDKPGQPQGHPVDHGCIPEKGLTVKEGWDKYGICYRGSFLDDSEKRALEGLKGGWGRLGTQIPLAPIPFATLYSPAPYFTAPIDHEANPSRGALLRVALVGDFTKADGLLYYRINGGPTQTFEERSGQLQDERRFFAEVGEGSHLLKTWRQVNPTSGPIAGSERTWPFSVGALPTLLTVPNVVGQTESAARAAIGNAHLIVDSTTSRHDPVAAGLVVSQSPAGGSQVVTGSSVSLVLSLGPVMQVAVPNLIGQAQTQAQLLANGAGLALGALMTVHHPSVLAGLVIAQSPVADTLVDLGTTIAITVSLGPDLPPPPPVETWTDTTIKAERSNMGRTRIIVG